MEIKIRMKSKNESKPRTVLIKKNKFDLSFYCNCPVGMKSDFCEHKISLVSGDENMLYDENDKESFNTVAEWIKKFDTIRL